MATNMEKYKGALRAQNKFYIEEKVVFFLALFTVIFFNFGDYLINKIAHANAQELVLYDEKQLLSDVAPVSRSSDGAVTVYVHEQTGAHCYLYGSSISCLPKI